MMSPHAATLTQRHAPLLRAFISYDALSRAELVDLCATGRSTASALLDDLLAAGWVSSAGRRPARGLGRPTELFRLHVPGALVLSVTFNGQRMQVTLLGLRGERFGQRTATVSTATHFNEFFAALHNAAQELIRDLRDPSAGLLACVVVVPAAVDQKQHAASAHVHPSWRQIALGDRISAGLGVPVVVENDANVLSLGAATNDQTTLAVVVGTGIGVGTVVAGRLVRGRDGLAGEIGHIRLENTAASEPDMNAWLTTTTAAEAIVKDPEHGANRAAATGRMLGSALITTVAVLGVDQIVVQCANDTTLKPLISALEEQLQAGTASNTHQRGVTVRRADATEVLEGALRVVHRQLLLLTPEAAS